MALTLLLYLYLVTNNKFNFYNITDIADKKYKILDKALKHIIVQRVFTIHQLAHFLDKRFRKIQI